MRIGIDFDNTLICYDNVFCEVAKAWELVDSNFTGTKKELRDKIQQTKDGDLLWQRLQGQVYGKYIDVAKPFAGLEDFFNHCQKNPSIQLFVVSHKTIFGHYDEAKINLREAALGWLREQKITTLIPESHIFFESTREEKIARIVDLHCTHFIDDLEEVLDSPLFPKTIRSFLFTGKWNEITHDIFFA